MHCILMDLFHELICLRKIGYKLMEILELLLVKLNKIKTNYNIKLRQMQGMTFIQKISTYTLGFLEDKDLPDIAMTGRPWRGRHGRCARQFAPRPRRVQARQAPAGAPTGLVTAGAYTGCKKRMPVLTPMSNTLGRSRGRSFTSRSTRLKKAPACAGASKISTRAGRCDVPRKPCTTPPGV